MLESKMISLCEEAYYVLWYLLLTCVILSTEYWVLSLGYVLLYFKTHRIIGIIISLTFIGWFYGQFHLLQKETFDETISCTISTFPVLQEGVYKFECKNKEGKLLVNVTTDETLKIGDHISIKNNLERVEANTVPHQFNYAHYLLSHHIVYRSFNDELLDHQQATLPLYQLIQAIIEHYESLSTKEYLLSFLIGYKTSLDDSFRDQLQMMNLSHLFVVSGFHVGFLYLIFQQILKVMHVTKERSQWIIFTLLCFFLWLNQESVSIFRAVLFLVFYHFKEIRRLPISSIQILSVITLLQLFVNPYVFYDAGFILSYLITFALLFSQSLLGKKQFIKNLLGVNILAQGFSLPIVANFTFEYNFISLITTPLFSLYYTFVIFPCTLFLLLIPKLNPVLSLFFEGYEIILESMSRISYFNVNIGAFTFMRSSLYFLLGIGILKGLELKQKKFGKGIVWVGILFFYHLFTFNGQVTYIDVGQGDSVYLESPFKSCTVLIDSGGTAFGAYHPGQNTVNYLKSIQTQDIDYFFISHTDTDHSGDYNLILDAFQVKNIVFSPYDASSLHDEIVNYAIKKNVTIRTMDTYNKIECGNLEFYNIGSERKNNTINENSLVLFLIFMEQTYLFTGDIPTSVELEILNRLPNTIDFLKVSHHGSNTATSDLFLDKVQPSWAIISVGANRYGHPSRDVIEKLANRQIHYYRTDQDGSIIVKYYLGFFRMICLNPP